MSIVLNIKSILVPVLISCLILIPSAACGGGPEELEVQLKLDGEKLSPETIQVGHGDTVTLNKQSSSAGEFHLHGYDIEIEVKPGETANMVFVADATGRFRITFHAEEAEDEHQGENGKEQTEAEKHEDEGEEVDVGFLEVRPR